MPAVIGRAIDRGVAAKDGSALLFWAGMMLLIGLVQAVTGIMRHRFAVTNWLVAAYRTVQLVGRHSVHLGGALSRKVSTGEVVAIGTSDLSHLGQLMDVTARFSGAIVSFLLVSVILLSTSVPLGLVVLVGVPLLMLLIGPLLRPLQERSAHQRSLISSLSNTATDIVSGLRVLRGIGGEQVFHDRYRRESQATRRAGVEVARVQSVLEALQVFLPGVFVVLIVWLGARSAVGGDITPGELVAFYGYAAFLMIPLRTVTEFANKLIRARVSARRVCKVLAQHPDVVDPADARRVTASGVRPERRPHRLPGAGRVAGGDRGRPARRVGAPRRPARPDGGRARRRRPAGRRTPHQPAPRRGAVADPGLRHRHDPVLRTPRRPPRRRRPRGPRPGARHGLGGGRPRRAARRARRGGHRARPVVLRRPATATRPRPRAHGRPGGARARRAHVGGRRAHRGADRGSSRRPPGRADHRRHVVQPAGARRGRRGRLPLRGTHRRRRPPP